METRYIFITGGVASSLGKGIISASLGKLLQARGFNITIQKLDPYDEYSAERLLHLYGKKREWDAMKKFYDAFCKRLSDELGIEPGEAVVSAYEKGRMV